MLRAQACRRPVLDTHAETQAVAFQNFLDFGQRLFAEVGRPEKLNFSALYKIADVHDVLCFQAVGRTNSQFQLVNRAQQYRIHLVLSRSPNALVLTLQVDKD